MVYESIHQPRECEDANSEKNHIHSIKLTQEYVCGSRLGQGVDFVCLPTVYVLTADIQMNKGVVSHLQRATVHAGDLQRETVRAGGLKRPTVHARGRKKASEQTRRKKRS